jgi:hypothetical protein
MKSPPAVYPTRSQLAGWLEESGLTGEIVPLRGRTPFNNYLFTFRRAGV